MKKSGSQNSKSPSPLISFGQSPLVINRDARFRSRTEALLLNAR